MQDTFKKRVKRKLSSKSPKTPISSEIPEIVSVNDLIALAGPFVPPHNHKIDEFRYPDEISLDIFYPEFAKTPSFSYMGNPIPASHPGMNLPVTPTSTPTHGSTTPVEQYLDDDLLLDTITESLKLINLLANENYDSFPFDDDDNTPESESVAASPLQVKRQTSLISIGASSSTTTPGLDLDLMNDDLDDDFDDDLDDEALLCSTPPGLNIFIDPSTYKKNHLFDCFQVSSKEPRCTQLKYTQ